jgi:hypothetical protein
LSMPGPLRHPRLLGRVRGGLASDLRIQELAGVKDEVINERGGLLDLDLLEPSVIYPILLRLLGRSPTFHISYYKSFIIKIMPPIIFIIERVK